MSAFTAADHVTEREVGPWRDCTFASFLEVMRDGLPDGRDVPATVAEKEALRAAAGLPDDHMGATIAQGIAACERRYGLSGGYVVTTDWLRVREALGRADARLVVQGSMGSVTPWLRRWDVNFSGAHAVAARGLVWCDPLAPAGTYAGELVPIGTWESYFRGLPGAQAFITSTGGLTRMAGDFVVYEPHVDSRRSGQPAGSTPFFNDWAMTQQRGKFTATPNRVQVLGYRGDAYAVEVNTAQGWPDRVQRPTLVFVAKAKVSDLRDDADPTPYTQADLDAAYARGKAAGDVKKTVTVTISDGRPPTVITGV